VAGAPPRRFFARRCIINWVRYKKKEPVTPIKVHFTNWFRHMPKGVAFLVSGFLGNTALKNANGDNITKSHKARFLTMKSMPIRNKIKAPKRLKTKAAIALKNSSPVLICDQRPAMLSKDANSEFLNLESARGYR